jgi:hypothetical protein
MLQSKVRSPLVPPMSMSASSEFALASSIFAMENLKPKQMTLSLV